MDIYIGVFLVAAGLLGLVGLFAVYYFSLSQKEEQDLFDKSRKHRDFLKKYLEYEKNKR
jgi:hypothetical protein